MVETRRALGAAGEELAARYLCDAGLTIVERNWRSARGEIDIVCRETGTDFASGRADACWLVFVEVRTRRGRSRGTALQAFPPTKQAKLRQLAQLYCQETAWEGPWRIDVVAVQMDRTGQVETIDHLRHAVLG